MGRASQRLRGRRWRERPGEQDSLRVRRTKTGVKTAEIVEDANDFFRGRRSRVALGWVHSSECTCISPSESLETIVKGTQMESTGAMFESYSQPARRVVFWARAEAGRAGSEMIEPEHILLGLLAEDQRDWAQVMARHFGEGMVGIVEESTSPLPFFSGERAGKLRQALAESANAGAPKPDTMDMPVAEGSQRVLVAAQERAGNATVGLVHILWGLMSEEGSISHLLKLNGITIDQVDDAIRRGGDGIDPHPA